MQQKCRAIENMCKYIILWANTQKVSPKNFFEARQNPNFPLSFPGFPRVFFPGFP